MKLKIIPFITLLLLFSSIRGFSQSLLNCSNSDFEMASVVFTIPSVNVVPLTNAIPGWTVNGGTNTGTVNSCNLNTCCSVNPSNVQLIGTSSTVGYIDPNIGPSYPVFSVWSYSYNPNANPFINSWGNWFCKMNDDIANKSIQKLSRTQNWSLPLNVITVSVLPVMSSTNHVCCSAPVLKIILKDGSGNPISSTNFSITPNTACSTVSNWSICPSNPSFQYAEWQNYSFFTSTFTTTTIEITMSDCSDGLHAGYVYIDVNCENISITANSTGYNNLNNNPVTVCGSTCAALSAPKNMSSYLWNGPDVNVNGATTQSVNACVNGVYTLTMNSPTFINPVPITFTLNCVPNPIVTMSTSQSTACVGGNTITLSGSPSGGVYTGSFVTGNIFNPSSIGNYSVSYTYTDSNGCSDTATKNITVNSCTGINNLTMSNFNAELYPQPTKDLVNINLINSYNKNIEVKIFDITGKEIERKELEVNQSKTQFSTSYLPNGIYILQLKNSQGQVAVKRLVVSR